MNIIMDLLKISGLICFIEKTNEKLTVYNANKVDISDNISNGIKSSYAQSLNRADTVWILVGCNGDKRKILQVGKNVNIKGMLENDIISDVKCVIETRPDDEKKKYLKYHCLMSNNTYDSLRFYEVNILKCLKNDKIFHKFFSTRTTNKYYNQMYSRIAAGYCEGKIAALYKADIGSGGIWYRSSGIEGIAFDMYKKVRKKVI